MLREIAAQSEPLVRAPARLRIARVESASDREKALATFDAGLEEIRRQQDPYRMWLIGVARSVAAAVAPERLGGIEGAASWELHHGADALIRTMLQHGHAEAAVAYALAHDEPNGFPFGMVGTLIHSAGDESTRTALLRRTADAWRATLDNPFHTIHRFLDVFQRYWDMLPRSEARILLHEIVYHSRKQPPQTISATYDPEGTVQITTAHENTFFLLLPGLRALDPELMQSLLSEYAEFAAAARRFPNGMQSVLEEANARAAERKTTGRAYCFAGAPDDFPYMESLMAAEADGKFDEPLQLALAKYASDVSNQAPKEFWRSTNALRSVLYRAGKRLGRAADVYLDRIPDEALRLFAAIELEAALAGLSEFSGVIVEQRRPDR